MQERRKVAWSRVNPTTVSFLPEDEEEGKEMTLFGGGFLERASKRIEEEKMLAKVTGSKPPPPECQRVVQPQKDLRRFLEQGARAKYSGRNPQCPQQYSNQQRHNQKSFKGNSNSTYCKFPCCNNFQQYLYPYYWSVPPPLSWPIPTLHPELAGVDCRQLGFAGGQRLQVGIGCAPYATVSTSNHCYFRYRSFKTREQSRCPILALDSTSAESSWFPVRMVHSDQWWTWDHWTNGDSSLQNGKFDDDKGPPSGRGLDGLNRFERCIPVSVGIQGALETSPLLMDGNTLRVSEPTIWPVQCSQSLHQIDLSIIRPKEFN